MARKEKRIFDGGVDKRELGYYSTPKFVADYISTELLKLNPAGVKVLDPAVGKEELLDVFLECGKSVSSFDIISHTDDYKSEFKQLDFLKLYREFKTSGGLFGNGVKADYDYMIANPPYNCHEVSYIKDNKDWLKKLFPVGVYNMYSMFLSAMIDMAKDGCLIGVITSDSFLTAAYHSKLRDQIFNTCSIHQLLLCPSNLFSSQKADVRTCIMILQKGCQYQGKVKIANRTADIHAFKELLQKSGSKEVSLNDIRLNCGNQIVIDVDKSIVNIFSSYPLLGRCYKCVTCISTGNDNKYLRAFPNDGFTIPFYKNPASRKFLASPDAYLRDDYLEIGKQDRNFMVRNKNLLNNEGIACSSMGLQFSAAYLPQKAVTGVNPTIYPPKEDIHWLMSYLNSSLVTYLVRGVIIRSNMVTSGYVSSIPILDFTDKEKSQLTEIALQAYNGEKDIADCIADIDLLIKSKSVIPASVYDKTVDFAHNLSKSV